MNVNLNAEGLSLNGHLFSKQETLDRYQNTLGFPSRTIEAGPPAPYGHRNNQIHIFDKNGIYLTEHHASRLIESVNFVLDADESPFPVEAAFCGKLVIDGQAVYGGMPESEIDSGRFERYLAGKYSSDCGGFWVGITAKARRNTRGKRGTARYIALVSVCLRQGAGPDTIPIIN